MNELVPVIDTLPPELASGALLKVAVPAIVKAPAF
jgi:hypothetical protein